MKNLIKILVALGVMLGISQFMNTYSYAQDYYTTDDLNYRVSPSLSGEILGTLPKGTKVNVIQIGNKWNKCNIEGRIVYLYNEFLTQKNKMYIGEYELTAYCGCTYCTNGLYITYSGTVPCQGRTVGCNSIPQGTRIYIEGIGVRIVEDTGNMADNVIDIFFNSHYDAIQFGRERNRKIYILN